MLHSFRHAGKQSADDCFEDCLSLSRITAWLYVTRETYIYTQTGQRVEHALEELVKAKRMTYCGTYHCAHKLIPLLLSTRCESSGSVNDLIKALRKLWEEMEKGYLMGE